MLEKLKRSVKECPVVEMDGYHYFIHPLSDGLPEVEPDLLEEVVDTVIEISDLDCDYILTAQSMGFPLAVALSMRTGLPYKFIRKRKYGIEGEISINQVTGYSKSEMFLNFIGEDDRVFLIDDVLSTGGTLRGIITALQKIGAEVVDVVVIFEKVEKEQTLEEDLGVEIKSLLKIRMNGSEVEVVD